ncbi:MAG: FHA domain-containing protein [Planctomycetota bacterium]|mgnify:CR=1 FL=1
MQASLILVKPDGSSQDIPLRKPRVLIGRGDDAAVRMNSPGVSRQHCELQIDDARLAVKDLGSSNGTFVNRRRITQTELVAGDVLSLGEFVFVVKIDGQPAKVNAPEALKKGHHAADVAGHGGKSEAKDGDQKTRISGPGKAKSDKSDSNSSSEWDFDFLEGKDEGPKL